jgi:hypothetical protein
MMERYKFSSSTHQHIGDIFSIIIFMEFMDHFGDERKNARARKMWNEENSFEKDLFSSTQLKQKENLSPHSYMMLMALSSHKHTLAAVYTQMDIFTYPSWKIFLQKAHFSSPS